MRLAQALRLGTDPCLAFTGAGGKTTALFELARQLPPPVLLTATTHLATGQLSLADRHSVLRDPEEAERALNELQPEVNLLTGPAGESERTSGLDQATLERVHALAEAWGMPLIIEADGSRLHPLKAPADHEPAIPPWVDEVVVVAGLSGLGKPLSEEWVHRPERFTTLTGLKQGETISVEALARLLAHPEGGLKNIPPRARRVALLNQADTTELQAVAGRLAILLQLAYSAILVASLHTGGEGAVRAVYERVAGVILAAGGSSRLGRPKQLLDWHGVPFVRQVARTALEAGLSPVVVVTGADADQVAAPLQDLPVSVVNNPDWAAGQGSSVATGVRALPPETGAAIFLLVDQPQVQPELINSLVAIHRRTLAAVVAPQADGQRANPVLFDRVTFDDLLALKGDVGGRSIFSRYQVEWLPWHDSRLLLDVDTLEDYRRLLDSGA